MSFDVVGLFPNIPINPTLQFASELLDQAVIDFVTKIEFFRFSDVRLSPNLWTYDNNLYQLPEGIGVLIGSPFGWLRGELFMHRLEREALQP